MSGIIALVNDARIAAGKSPLGFLNPWIYSKGFNGFTDITSGSAVGCSTRGFPAVTGWDPVTVIPPFSPSFKLGCLISSRDSVLLISQSLSSSAVANGNSRRKKHLYICANYIGILDDVNT